MVRPDMRKLLSGPSALVSPRVLLGVGLVLVTSLFGGTGCGLSYSLTGLNVEPTAGLTCVGFDMTAQFKAYGTYTEGGHTSRIEDISDQVSWSASLPQLAEVSTSGLATAATGFAGTTPIVATTTGEFGDLTSESSLQVSTQCVPPSSQIAHPFSLHIVAGNPSLTVGNMLQPLAIATYPGAGRTADLSRQATWSSSNTSIASVDADGVIAAVAPGDATITARVRTPDGDIVSAAQTIHFPANGQDQ
jgi:hypothetical protein